MPSPAGRRFKRGSEGNHVFYADFLVTPANAERIWRKRDKRISEAAKRLAGEWNSLGSKPIRRVLTHSAATGLSEPVTKPLAMG